MPETELNKIISDNMNKYMERNGKTQADLADYMNVSQATVSNWCKGLKMPRMDKINKICAYFHINRSDLMEEKTDDPEDSYYLDDDSKDMAEFMFKNPEYKVLFDASRKVKPEDINFVKEMIERMSNK